uniref:Uncharacterized protein n=1 Tax=Suricata suricatta TaxID=37032 RepID=A0A673U6L4_SURSU
MQRLQPLQALEGVGFQRAEVPVVAQVQLLQGLQVAEGARVDGGEVVGEEPQGPYGGGEQGGKDGLHLEWTSVGQPESVPMEIIFDNRFFGGIAEFKVLFFKTLLQQDVKKRRGWGNSSDSRYEDGRGLPGDPPRRMGPISHLRGLSPPPMAEGGGR